MNCGNDYKRNNWAIHVKKNLDEIRNWWLNQENEVNVSFNLLKQRSYDEYKQTLNNL